MWVPQSIKTLLEAGLPYCCEGTELTYQLLLITAILETLGESAIISVNSHTYVKKEKNTSKQNFIFKIQVSQINIL